jgi:hypothetical protein
MKTAFLLAISAALAVSPTSAFAQHATHGVPAQTTAAAKASPAPKLQATLRHLWQGHIARTRDYALAVQTGSTDKAKRAEQAVVSNAKEISQAVASFYGAAAGDHMFTLLAGHWGSVKAMTDAEKKKDKAAHAAAIKDITANAQEIAIFLSGANPYLPKDAVFGLLVAHGGHHAAQITQIMAGDMKAEKSTQLAMQAHMDTIADALAQALAKQFPKKAS